MRLIEQLNKALELMNRAVTGGSGPSQPGARENVAYLTTTERRRAFEPVPPPAPINQEVKLHLFFCLRDVTLVVA
jgi:hypothetical protein